MTDLVPHEPWAQMAGERDHEYAWFTHYAESFGDRDLAKVSRSIGVSVKLIREAAAKHGWEARAAAFDKAREDVLKHVVVDDSEALQMQYAVGIAMMRLGVQAVQLKNPALIKMKDIRELMQQGAEMARRGAGIADLNIEIDVQKRIENEFLDLIGEE